MLPAVAAADAAAAAAAHAVAADPAAADAVLNAAADVAATVAAVLSGKPIAVSIVFHCEAPCLVVTTNTVVCVDTHTNKPIDTSTITRFI